MEAIVKSEAGLPIGEADDWICICGNMPSTDGFYPCTADGVEVEPFPETWSNDLYICARCTRIIDGKDGSEVRGPGPYVLPT